MPVEGYLLTKNKKQKQNKKQKMQRKKKREKKKIHFREDMSGSTRPCPGGVTWMSSVQSVNGKTLIQHRISRGLTSKRLISITYWKTII